LDVKYNIRLKKSTKTPPNRSSSRVCLSAFGGNNTGKTRGKIVRDQSQKIFFLGLEYYSLALDSTLAIPSFRGFCRRIPVFTKSIIQDPSVADSLWMTRKCQVGENAKHWSEKQDCAGSIVNLHEC
jgi:hypothetical protein